MKCLRFFFFQIVRGVFIWPFFFSSCAKVAMGLCVCALRLIECCVAEHVAYIVVCYSDTWSDDDRERCNGGSGTRKCCLEHEQKSQEAFRSDGREFIYFLGHLP